jgi:hypothetical protein
MQERHRQILGHQDQARRPKELKTHIDPEVLDLEVFFSLYQKYI